MTNVRFLEKKPVPRRAGDRCEMCSADLTEDHSHLVNVATRQLMCACRPCSLLFVQVGAAHGRYRAVPNRYLYDAEFALTDAVWDTLQIPVNMAFFFYNSSLGKYVAFFPSPAGATESELPLDMWAQVLADNPRVGEPEPDVEALLVFRRGGRSECFLAPIDACYELVGRVRMLWKGFDGGQELWADLDEFFSVLRAAAVP